MKHYYVVSGSEYGINIQTKENFNDLLSAECLFEQIKYDDFATVLMFVDENGKETKIQQHINE